MNTPHPGIDEKNQNDTGIKRWLRIIDGTADEIAQQAELLRTLGKKLVLLVAENPVKFPVEWKLRIGDEQSVVHIDIAVDHEMSIGCTEPTSTGYPLWKDDADCNPTEKGDNPF